MVIYQYDGDIEGYLTAVYDAQFTTEPVLFTTNNTSYQIGFDTTFIEVKTDLDKCDNLIADLRKALSSKHISDIYYAFESASPDKDLIIFNYIRLTLQHEKNVLEMQSHPYVILFSDIVHKVRNEIHKMSGFIRFVKTKSDIYYAAYSPENNITSFLVKEFVSRYPIMSFVLHDVVRGILGIYNGKDYVMIRDKRKASIEYAEDEHFISDLWRKYYASVNIKERYNRRQMMNYMPRKYIDNIYTFNDFDK